MVGGRPENIGINQMKTKFKIKIAIDILMTAGLFFLSGYQFWGEELHEWIGAGMFVLYCVHHILNGNWHKNLPKGKYTLSRGIQTAVDAALFLAMLSEMYSGIVLSRHVFAFLPIGGGLSLARKLHILGAYWGFLLMSVHLGMHWKMVINLISKKIGFRERSRLRAVITNAVGGGIALYGIFVFIKRDFITYLFLKSEFVFLDYTESPVLFYLDYAALMGLCIFIFYYIEAKTRRHG